MSLTKEFQYIAPNQKDNMLATAIVDLDSKKVALTYRFESKKALVDEYRNDTSKGIDNLCNQCIAWAKLHEYNMWTY